MSGTYPKILTVILFFMASSCSHGLWSKYFSRDDKGVPLSDFKAKNGDYFPPFIQEFFSGAKAFTKSAPSLAEARSGLQLVEVKRLTDESISVNEANLNWSADGVYLGFEVITDKVRKILVKNLPGNYARELLVMPRGRDSFLEGMVVSSAQSYNSGLRWSQDSTRYAFMSNGGMGEYNIYVGAIGSKEKPVANSPTKDGYATWSPLGDDIAFVSARSGNGDIYVIQLKSKEVKRLSISLGVDIFPEWFPSGNAIVYSSGDALNHDIHIVERSGKSAWGQPKPLVAWSRDDLRPTVSPDGKYVSFYSDGGVNDQGLRLWNIIVVPYTKGASYGESQLKNMVVAKDVVIDLNTGPAWSPDSRKIFYVKRDPKAFNPIIGYDLFTGNRYLIKTDTRMNRDILMSNLGVLSFRAQVGVWDRVFVGLTNQGLQLQGELSHPASKINYVSM